MKDDTLKALEEMRKIAIEYDLTAHLVVSGMGLNTNWFHLGASWTILESHEDSTGEIITKGPDDFKSEKDFAMAVASTYAVVLAMIISLGHSVEKLELFQKQFEKQYQITKEDIGFHVAKQQ